MVNILNNNQLINLLFNNTILINQLQSFTKDPKLRESITSLKAMKSKDLTWINRCREFLWKERKASGVKSEKSEEIGSTILSAVKKKSNSSFSSKNMFRESLKLSSTNSTLPNKQKCFLLNNFQKSTHHTCSMTSTSKSTSTLKITPQSKTRNTKPQSTSSKISSICSE